MDTPTAHPPAAADQSVTKLIQDVGASAGDIKAAVAAYKAGGFPAVAALAPQLIPHVQAIIGDTKEAIPAIKAGYKTTEFWLTVAFGAANVIVPIFTGKALPFDVNGSLAAVLSVYAVVRAFVKSPATAPTVQVTK